MNVGILGFSGSGKSELLRAATLGKNSKGMGTVHVPDVRLEHLSNVFKPKKVTHAEIHFQEADTSSWIEDISSGPALGWLQKMNALMVVVRAFEDDSVAHPYGYVDFKKDIERLLFNFTFVDISILDKRIERMQLDNKGKSSAQRLNTAKHIDLLKEIQIDLENGKRLTQIHLTESHKAAIGDVFLVSRLPMLVTVNISEKQIKVSKEIEEEAVAVINDPLTACGTVCAKLENELLDMSEEESEIREAIGASKESGMNQIVKLTYQALGLISFLTAGKDEVRAWQIPQGTKAPKAAGKIHSDIERGFISAEVISYSSFISAGSSLVEAKRIGALRQEGKKYIVKDGDIVNFLFSV